ncbi:thiol peroxidase [Cyanobacteria bacterium FACHB-471]|nr:thiol peroxidase [Cyanobacteria bacterium FACHB-471]
MHITFHGKRMRLIGLPMKVGTRARDVRVIDNNLLPVLPLERSRGKVRLLLTVPSLDMPVCSDEIHKFSHHLTLLGQQLTDFVEVFLLSADLPFAQTRWQAIEKVTNITMLSDYRDLDFARSWGLLVQDLGLLTHAVYVVDSTGIVTYQEIVTELTAEPDYAVAFAVLSAEIATLKAAS